MTSWLIAVTTPAVMAGCAALARRLCRHTGQRGVPRDTGRHASSDAGRAPDLRLLADADTITGRFPAIRS